MNEEKLYLKPNVVIEPLIDRWYAWSHLVSPATAALNIVERHLKIMQSYIMAPEVHEQAARNPKMKGGPFMDFSHRSVNEVTQLQEWTLSNRQHMISLAQAIKELNNLLLSEAKGHGLEKIYEKVPAILQGYIELFYDLNNNAGYRFFESLLYKSNFYNKQSQSILLWITNNDHRPFCLSTPRTETADSLHLPISFDDPAIDALARMKKKPQSVRQIRERLGVPAEQEGQFDNFFTETPPPAYEKYSGKKIRMRYFGHACILIETNEISILIDPLVSYYGYDSSVDHYSDIHLPDVIDFALITHNHQDHVLFETLLPLRHRIRNLIVPHTNSGRLEDPDLKLMFNNIGFHQVTAFREMETINFGNTTITALPFTGEHSDLNILTKSCYLVEIGSFRLLFLADSRILEPQLYRHIHGITGDVDVIFLGMECDGAPLTWLYGPLLPSKISREQDNSRRLSGSDCQRGMHLVDIFNPKEVYVYAMGMEPWLEFISSIKYTDESNPIVQSNKLVQICRERGITAERLYGEKEILYEMQPALVI